jgi:hypothetical protein
MINDQGMELKPIFNSGARTTCAGMSCLAMSESVVSARMPTGVSAVVRKKKPAHLPCAL